jgi:hypothetical protein
MCDIFIMCFVLFLFVTCCAALVYMAAVAAAECVRGKCCCWVREKIGGVVT